MDRVRLVVWSVVILLALGVAAGVAFPELWQGRVEPTVDSIRDEHEDCGSGNPNCGDLDECLIERYRWPRHVAERFAAAMRYDHSTMGSLLPTDWDAFWRYAEDLLATYRALGVRDLSDVENEIWAWASVSALTDSIDASIATARRLRPFST
ncbi:MAG: hypothetical protein ACRET3_10145 [Burkholderiales bacterium]